MIVLKANAALGGVTYLPSTGWIWTEDINKARTFEDEREMRDYMKNGWREYHSGWWLADWLLRNIGALEVVGVEAQTTLVEV